MIWFWFWVWDCVLIWVAFGISVENVMQMGFFRRDKEKCCVFVRVRDKGRLFVLEIFYRKLKNQSKMLITFSFFHKFFCKWFTNKCTR